MIRQITTKDVPRLRGLEQGYEWEFGPDFMHAKAFVDENDRPVLIAGAWKRAEVHLVADGTWGTPGMRQAALEQLHAAMAQQLKSEGVGEALTFMDGMKAFCRRLQRLGWGKTDKAVWARRL
jgi:hypothetical protein